MMRSKLLCVQKQPQEVFYKKGVLKNFAKFTRKHMCQSLFFNKVAGPGSLFFKEQLFYRTPLVAAYVNIILLSLLVT